MRVYPWYYSQHQADVLFKASSAETSDTEQQDPSLEAARWRHLHPPHTGFYGGWVRGNQTTQLDTKASSDPAVPHLPRGCCYTYSNAAVSFCLCVCVCVCVCVWCVYCEWMCGEVLVLRLCCGWGWGAGPILMRPNICVNLFIMFITQRVWSL